MHCLISFAGEKEQPVVMWSDWYPSPVAIACIRGFLFLRSRGFVMPGRSAVEVVQRYQKTWNATAPSPNQLDTDGACGRKTLASMGIAVDG